MSAPLSPRARRRWVPQLEQLESREVLSGVPPTAVEQQFLELLNDVRANPAAYGAAAGVDLSNVAPSQPLAFDPQLIEAALGHSQDMNDQGYFSHVSSGGADPGARIAAAGFANHGWGESIAAGYPDPAAALKALVVDTGEPELGHRRQLLAIDAVYRDHDAVGVGIVQNGTGAYKDYYTIDTAVNSDTRPYLTGVVFSDANRNGKYDPGEGLGGVTVTVQGAGATTTFGSGGYSLQLNPGTYAVTFNGGLTSAVTKTVSVGATNYRLTIPANAAPTGGVSQATSLTGSSDSTWLTQTYQSLLGRAPSANDSSYWLNALQHGVARDAAAAAIVSSPEYVTAQSGKWLTAVYPYLTGRAPGAADFSYWLNVMQQGGSRDAIVASIAQSVEARRFEGSQWLPQAYQNLLHRAPSAGDFAYWLTQLQGGATHEQVAAQIVASPEYLGKLSNTSAAWIDQAYQDLLHRHAGAGDLSYWTGVLQSGTPRSNIALQIMASGEYRTTDWVGFVAQLYHDLLNRDPQSGDLTYWVGALQGGAMRPGALAAFFSSPEFTGKHPGGG